MEKVKVGVIGLGYIGRTHVETLQRLRCVEIVAVADPDTACARRVAEDFNISRCYQTPEDLLADPAVQVVHDCTPNHMHFPINAAAIRQGKHVFSEKPLTLDSAEAVKLVELLREHPDVVAGVNFCYRMYPLAQEMRARIAGGEIGRPRLVHGSYLQDWMLFDTDYNWRVERRYAGVSRCVADIGSHWIDLAQNIVGSRITEVCADLLTAFSQRKKPAAKQETFSSGAGGAYTLCPVDTEDYAGVLVHFANGASGVFHCSQISAGRKCFIDFEVDGERASFHWNHETPNQMWMGNRDSANLSVMRNPALMPEQARCYSSLAAGHAEGWNDAFKNNLDTFYRFILQGSRVGRDPCDFATFEDACYIMRLTEAIIRSGQERRWVSIDEV